MNEYIFAIFIFQTCEYQGGRNVPIYKILRTQQIDDPKLELI